jgi:hypothetical protein
MRAFAAISIALALCAAPALAAPRNHATAARKAERRGEWRKALREWKAAYAKEAKPEYLIGIGDAHSHLGNNAEAKKSYEAYLADPLSVPARIAKVKEKIAGLEQSPAEPSLPMLPLPSTPATPAVAERIKEANPPLPPPRREPPPPTVTVAPAKVEPREPSKKEAVAAVASNDGPALPPKIALAANPVAERLAPVAAFSAAPLATQPRTGSSRAQRTLAYVTAGVAIAALGGGVLAYTQAGSTHSELTNGIHGPAETQRLLDDERRYRTLSLVGLAGGLLTAGIATALFVF